MNLRYLVFSLLLLMNANTLVAQQDSIPSKDSSLFKPVTSEQPKRIYKREFKTRLGTSLITPTAIIALGLTTIRDNGLYSSYDAKRDIQKKFPNFNNRLDDFMIWAPYAELLAVNFFKVPCKNDPINTILLILKSQILMSAIVFTTKSVSNQVRPDSSNFNSFPSGHTANAFVAASIVHKEFRHESNWYGVGAYAIATTVAAFRMLNNKHWLSDVIVGAGVGILSVHAVYATHQFRWGRREICMSPSFFPNKGKGLALAMKF